MAMQSERTCWAEGTGLDEPTVEALTEICEEARERGIETYLPPGDVWGAWAIALEDAGAPDLAARVTALEMEDPTAITDEQIEALRTEALAAGDEEQAMYCERALSGDESARALCEQAISYTRAEAAYQARLDERAGD